MGGRRRWIFALVLGAAAVAALGVWWISDRWSSQASYVTAAVRRAPIAAEVTATGKNPATLFDGDAFAVSRFRFRDTDELPFDTVSRRFNSRRHHAN